MPRKSGHADIADKIRGAAKIAMSRLDMADLIEQHLKSDFLSTLTALSKWRPPELKVDHTFSVADDATEALRRLNAAGNGVRESVRGSGEAVGEAPGDVRH